MLIEQLYYRGLGVRKEFPNLNPIATALMMAKTAKYLRDHKPIIKGYSLPEDGPILVTGNHFQESDIYKATAVAWRSHRLIRSIARRSLIVKGAIESKEYLQSIGGDAEHEDDYDPLKAFVLRGLGIIDTLRDTPDVSVGRRGNAVLKSHQILGVFFQPTRYKDCILRNLETGAAAFARLNPTVPVYPMAFSGPPHGVDRVTVLKPFTYAQKVAEHGRKLSPGELTTIIADMVVEALPQHSQDDWKIRREAEILI